MSRCSQLPPISHLIYCLPRSLSAIHYVAHIMQKARSFPYTNNTQRFPPCYYLNMFKTNSVTANKASGLTTAPHRLFVMKCYLLVPQSFPAQPAAQVHAKSLTRSKHLPPFLHGLLAQSSLSETNRWRCKLVKMLQHKGINQLSSCWNSFENSLYFRI